MPAGGISIAWMQYAIGALPTYRNPTVPSAAFTSFAGS